MKHTFYSLLCLVLLTVGCSSPKSATKPNAVNLSNMYNPINTRIHPAYTVYHNSPSGSFLLVKIFPVELLYSGTIEPDKLLGQVSLTYTLTDITNPQKTDVADSGKVVYTFARENADKRFQTQIPLKTESGKVYQLALLARDLVRNQENLTYLYVDKSQALSEQNFLITSTDENTPVYQPYVVGNSTFKIGYNGLGYDSVYVLYYGKEIPLPRPSFSMTREKEFLEKPDSLWVLPFRKDISYQLNYEGVYFFQLDTTQASGLTLFNFGFSYPKVQETKQLVESLAYLTTSAEYDALKKATNQKLAVDNYWIEKAGNIERARELIRVYYTRVYFANYYFTSFKPGWMTDRGMIFIIYGPPQSVKVSPTQERWIYYKNNFTTTVTFTFDYERTAFSTDNFILQRADNYDSYWRSAIDTWRKGNIYMIE